MVCFLKVVGASALLVGLLCVGLIYYGDQPLLLLFRQLRLYGLGSHTESVLQINEYITLMGAQKGWMVISLLAFLLAGIGYKMGRYPRQCRALLYIGTTSMLAMSVGGVLKFVLGRSRPIEFFQANLYGFEFFSMAWAQHSMPSGHTVAIFAGATALSVLYRRYGRPLFFTVAIFVALSRLVLEMHYLSDIILGAYIGIISALFMRHILYKDKIKTC
ncbi:MAG: phosphatase PAP2 family protein [Gammaproteobacteria bacterium]